MNDSFNANQENMKDVRLAINLMYQQKVPFQSSLADMFTYNEYGVDVTSMKNVVNIMFGIGIEYLETADDNNFQAKHMGEGCYEADFYNTALIVRPRDNFIEVMPAECLENVNTQLGLHTFNDYFSAFEFVLELQNEAKAELNRRIVIETLSAQNKLLENSFSKQRPNVSDPIPF